MEASSRAEKPKKLGLVDLIGGEKEAVKYLEEKKILKDFPW